MGGSDVVDAALAAGLSAIALRMPDAAASDLVALTEGMATLARELEARRVPREARRAPRVGTVTETATSRQR